MLQSRRKQRQRHNSGKTDPCLKGQRAYPVGALHKHRTQRPGRRRADHEQQSRTQPEARRVPHYQHHTRQGEDHADCTPEGDMFTQQDGRERDRDWQSKLGHDGDA